MRLHSAALERQNPSALGLPAGRGLLGTSRSFTVHSRCCPTPARARSHAHHARPAPLWLQAEARQLPAALQHAQHALAASQGEHGPSWALLALVLSAQQELPQALAASEAGLNQAGPNHSPLLLKIKVGACWMAFALSAVL